MGVNCSIAQLPRAIAGLVIDSDGWRGVTKVIASNFVVAFSSCHNYGCGDYCGVGDADADAEVVVVVLMV